MILLFIFAFLAGIVTVLSPCILPILPIVLSSATTGDQKDKTRPYGIVIGFIASFTLFTLFLTKIVQLFQIPSDILRWLSILIVLGLGLSLLLPKFQILLEALFSRLSSSRPTLSQRKGIIGGLIIGISLGILWTPCVGPILASVIALAITGTVTFNSFLIMLAYSAGTALPMLGIIVGGQTLLKKVTWLRANTLLIQKIFGVVMIATAIAIFFNIDRKFQTIVLNVFPNYGKGLTKVEDNSLVQSVIKNLNGTTTKDNIGKPTSELIPNKGSLAPAIVRGGQWFNSEPLRLDELKDKVVLIDFWTYSCINCQRTLPYLKSWWEKYKDKGLVIIGVHSPEFEFEKNPQNVEKAIKDFGLTYPIVQDNAFDTWRNYENRYWPAKYIIDKEGYIRYTHFGEGAYDETEKTIQKLLSEINSQEITQDIDNPGYQLYSRTHETYLGYSRISNFSSPELISPGITKKYSSPTRLQNNKFAYEGNWTVSEEFSNPQKGARLYFNFDAKEVFLVMRTKQEEAKIKVFVDGVPQSFGIDVKNGEVIINADRLYKLVNLENPGRHILMIEFQDNNVEVFAFTFG